MSNKIQELANQAKLNIPVGRLTVNEWIEAYNQKFAELIVRDCLDIAFEVRGEPATDTHYVIGYDRACEKMISGIREHFGVE